QPDAPMLGLHHARGAGGHNAGSSDLIYRGGAIMTSSEVTALYWGPSWADALFVGDKLTGLDTFYSGVGGSSHMGTNTEYTGTNGQVGSAVTYHGHIVDTSAGPRKAPNTSTVAAEVCKLINNPVANGYYPVYTDLKRGNAGYCAWHSFGTCQGVPVQYGFFFDLDGDPGCDPRDFSGLHSQGAAALANVSRHELTEAIAHPRTS